MSRAGIGPGLSGIGGARGGAGIAAVGRLDAKNFQSAGKIQPGGFLGGQHMAFDGIGDLAPRSGTIRPKLAAIAIAVLKCLFMPSSPVRRVLLLAGMPASVGLYFLSTAPALGG